VTTRQPLALEDLIGLVLLIGVLLSAAIIAVGVILLIPPGNDKLLLLSQLFSEHDVLIAGLPRTFGGIVQGALKGQPVAVIDVGVLLLIFTPVLRVALSAVFFAVRRDRLYAIVSTVVLALLLLGFALRKIT
jgi:uncharacterized membrane protein